MRSVIMLLHFSIKSTKFESTCHTLPFNNVCSKICSKQQRISSETNIILYMGLRRSNIYFDDLYDDGVAGRLVVKSVGPLAD